MSDSGLEPSKLPLSLILTRAWRGWEWGCPLLLFLGVRGLGLGDFIEVWGILKRFYMSLVASAHACAPSWKL